MHARNLTPQYNFQTGALGGQDTDPPLSVVSPMALVHNTKVVPVGRCQNYCESVSWGMAPCPFGGGLEGLESRLRPE